MKRVILTGATGFVGANLAQRLLKEGHEVHLLLRKGYSRWRIDSIQDEVNNIHIVDLSDVEALGSCVASIRPDWVFHLAAYGAYSSQTNFSEMLRTNLMGLINLVNACLQIGFEAFINTGSSSEYGIKDHAPLEIELPEPNSDYAFTKLAGTTYCRFIAQSKNVNIQTLRLYSVYGPFEEPSRLLPRLILYGLKGKYPPLVNPEIGRDFVYIVDVCRAYELAARSQDKERGAIYNVGTGRQSTIGSVVQIVRDTLQIEEEPRWGSMPVRNWDTNIWVANPRKIMDKLSWEPRYTLEKGIGEMVAWLRSNPTLRSFYEEMGEVLPE